VGKGGGTAKRGWVAGDKGPRKTALLKATCPPASLEGEKRQQGEKGSRIPRKKVEVQTGFSEPECSLDRSKKDAYGDVSRARMEGTSKKKKKRESVPQEMGGRQS